MKFTDYVVTETAGESVDPLGYLKPGGALSKKVFRQFTGLSNHPSYQGFLAFAFSYLAKKSITPSKREFARRVRDLEILWGMLNTKANNSVSIINVTKFKPLADLDSLRLSQARQRSSLYARLSYGALGHYARPSTAWNILEVGPLGLSLTRHGNELAEAWSNRKGLNFDTLANRWFNGEDLYSIPDMEKWQSTYCLSATPNDFEKEVWKSLIENLCVKDPIIAPLWENPVPEKVLNFLNAEETYSLFFPALQKHYEAYDELQIRIERCNRFGRLSSLVLFVFEWEYVRRLEEIRLKELKQGNLPIVVTQEIVKAAKDFISDLEEDWPLPRRLTGITDYQDLARVILDHHAYHQRSKGAAPFIVGDTISVQGRVDAKNFINFFDEIRGNPERLAAAVQWRYPRDWHFQRAHRWQCYAGLF